jgi:glycosyltransferase involved in cell wall biosynthesis
MCQALTDAGHEVILLAPDRTEGREAGVADVAAFYGVSDRFRRELLPWPNVPFRAILFALAVARRVHVLKPDFVCSRSIHSGLLAALFGHNVLLEAHAPIWEYSRLVAAAMRRLAAARRLHKLVVVTQALKDAYVSRGYFRDEDVVVAPNGAPTMTGSVAHDRSPGQRPGQWPGRLRALQVGYVGQLYPGKGMEVIARIAPRLPDVDFHVVGGMEPDIDVWRGKTPSRNVLFHGFARQEELAGIFARLDVCLLPNQRKVTGFGGGRNRKVDLGEITSPLKMFEYMAHRKAIVASDLPVLREVLNERNAILVDPEDDDGWVAAIRKLADPGFRATLGEQAGSDFLRDHTVAARARRIVQAATASPFPIAPPRR